MEQFIEKRILENKELFTRKELKVIKNNKSVIKKIYMLGAMNIMDTSN